MFFQGLIAGIGLGAVVGFVIGTMPAPPNTRTNTKPKNPKPNFAPPAMHGYQPIKSGLRSAPPKER